jgi:hypothetical protein
MMPQRHRHRHRRTCSEMYGLVRDESECYPARNQEYNSRRSATAPHRQLRKQRTACDPG